MNILVTTSTNVRMFFLDVEYYSLSPEKMCIKFINGERQEIANYPRHYVTVVKELGNRFYFYNGEIMSDELVFRIDSSDESDS